MALLNQRWLINARPNGRALRHDDFLWDEAEVSAPQEGEVLVRTLFLSFDPAQKGWMENIGGYAAPTQIGEVMRGSGVGEVLESRDPTFAPGDKVTGPLGWQAYATLRGAQLNKVEDDEHLTANLGVLGNTGLTAFFGMYKIAKPFPGDTVVVTGAAGATGSVVGQIAKMAGCRVVGVAGGPEKCRALVEEFGFDGAIDYKGDDVRRAIRAAAPDGIHVIWDNVGGPILDDLLAQIALNARVVICGGIARYEATEMPPGPQNYFNLVFRRARMEGLLLTDYVSEFPFARARLKAWLREGRLRHREDIQEGLQNAPETLMRLFRGANWGKQLLRVA